MTSFFVLRKFPQRFRFTGIFSSAPSLSGVFFFGYFFSFCLSFRLPVCDYFTIPMLPGTHPEGETHPCTALTGSTSTLESMINLHHLVAYGVSSSLLEKVILCAGVPVLRRATQLVPNITDVHGKGLDALHCVLMPSYPTYRADRRIFRSIGWWACTYSILFFSSPPTAPSFPSAPPPSLTCAGSYNYRPNVLNVARHAVDRCSKRPAVTMRDLCMSIYLSYYVQYHPCNNIYFDESRELHICFWSSKILFVGCLEGCCVYFFCCPAHAEVCCPKSMWHLVIMGHVWAHYQQWWRLGRSQYTICTYAGSVVSLLAHMGTHAQTAHQWY